MIPVIETDRLKLRPWEMDDFPAYSAFYGDAEMTRFIGGPRDSVAAWQHFCATCGEWLLRGLGILAVETKADGQLAGYAGLWFPFDIGEPELCWGLFRGFHGKGYATEAADAMRRWTHEALALPPLMSFTHPDNRASQQVASRLGATLLGETTLRGEPRLQFRHALPD